MNMQIKWLPKVTLMVLTFISSCALADSTGTRAWGINPHGRAWSEFYSPHDPQVFWDFGLDVIVSFQNPSRFEPFLYLQMRTGAGYNYSTVEEGPRTPIDMLHQVWQQGLGVTWQSAVPLYLFAYRDCNHQLDKNTNGFKPVLATTVLLAAGTLAPFRKDFVHFVPGNSRFGYAWLVAAGPAPDGGSRSVWHDNSAITGEAWVRALGTYRAWPHGTLDAYGELIGENSDLSPRVRHVVRNEFGLTLHAGSGGWRFYLGRRWRDTRELWPVDQRTYFGFEYLY